MSYIELTMRRNLQAVPQNRYLGSLRPTQGYFVPHWCFIESVNERLHLRLARSLVSPHHSRWSRWCSALFDSCSYSGRPPVHHRRSAHMRTAARLERRHRDMVCRSQPCRARRWTYAPVDVIVTLMVPVWPGLRTSGENVATGFLPIWLNLQRV
jgi:hypothetical protein